MVQSQDESPKELDSTNLSILARVISKTGAKIVLSSNWRVSGLADFQKAVYLFAKPNDMQVILDSLIGCTPLLEGPDITRAVEIQDWLDNNPGPWNWIVLDDMWVNVGKRLVQCGGDLGLTGNEESVILEMFKTEMK